MLALIVLGSLLALTGAAWGVLIGISRRNERRQDHQGRHRRRD